jgi:hypothetical protein
MTENAEGDCVDCEYNCVTCDEHPGDCKECKSPRVNAPECVLPRRQI